MPKSNFSYLRFFQAKMVKTVMLLILNVVFMSTIAIAQSKEAIHIAVAAPLSGDSEKIGVSVRDSANLYVDKINKEGGIFGRPIVLDIYDDKNTKVGAESVANQIVNDGRAVAVIGHYYSSNSIVAGEVYKNNKIPAITVLSTHVDVTRNNDWYFRVVFNDDLQARFLANYAVDILKQKNITIISENLSYGRDLAKVFRKEVLVSGATIVSEVEFDVEADTFDEKLDDYIDDLTKVDDPGLILFALHQADGAKIIRKLKAAGIKALYFGPDTFAATAFVEGFKDDPIEKNNPGYYAEGMYITTPMIFDTANVEAQRFKSKFKSRYQREPDWGAAFTFDAMMLVVDSLRSIYAEGVDTLPMDELRVNIRDSFKSYDSPEKALIGITGANYFDENGDSPKPIAIGVYRKNNVLSALTQLQTVDPNEKIAEFEEKLSSGKILPIDGKYMYRTSVVYSGMEIKSIDNIDEDKMTFDMRFNIWFRSYGKFNTEGVVFDSATDNISLGEPVKELFSGGVYYSLYEVEGEFKIDYVETSSVLDSHYIGVSFHHKDMPRENLIFVADLLGMGLVGEGTFLNRISEEKALIDPEWKVVGANFFQGNLEKSSRGNPHYLEASGGVTDFSSFNFSLKIKKNSLTLRGVIDEFSSMILMVLSVLFLVVTWFLLRLGYFAHNGLRFLLSVASGSAIILSSEVLLLAFVNDHFGFFLAQKTQLSFDVLWWLYSAFVVNWLVDMFVWDAVERTAGRSLPNLVRKFSASIVYMSSVFCVIAFVFDYQVTSLLATSGMLAMIIGLAVQINISNIFNGIAINIERPFRVGDWIKVGLFEEGQVVDISWRSTRLITWDGSTLNIPNSTAAEGVIHNFTDPTDRCWIWRDVFVDFEHSPEFVQGLLLQAAQETEGVMTDPPPKVYGKFNESSTKFSVVFCVEDYNDRHWIESKLWKNIWAVLREQGINLDVDAKLVVKDTPVGSSVLEVSSEPKIFNGKL